MALTFLLDALWKFTPTIITHSKIRSALKTIDNEFISNEIQRLV